MVWVIGIVHTYCLLLLLYLFIPIKLLTSVVKLHPSRCFTLMSVCAERIFCVHQTPENQFMSIYLIVEIFLKATWLVKVVMTILLLLSITSWTIILNRWLRLRRIAKLDRYFEQHYAANPQLGNLQQQILQDIDEKKLAGLPKLFVNGINLFRRSAQLQYQAPEMVVAYIDKNVNAAIVKEIDEQDFGLSMLSIITGISPYIGLFGTVWGIIEVFTSLGSAEQVNIQVIAPGISEALVATAMGLFVAIPALVFYNIFHKKVNLNENNYYNFSDTFVSILQEAIYQRDLAHKASLAKAQQTQE